MRLLGSDALVLPALTLFLVTLHVYWVRRHGVAPALTDENQPKRKFYPEQVARDTIAIFVWFVVLFGMSVFARVPLGHIADPTDLAYIPRPEWYFSFQFLKWFDGPLEVVGAVVIPTLAVIAILLIPFVDRTKLVNMRRRTGAVGIAALAVIGWGGLTAQAIVSTPETREMDMALIQPWQEISAGNLASVGYFRQAYCASCHPLEATGQGPDLTQSPSRRPLDWIQDHVRRKTSASVSSKLTDEQVQMLTTFLTSRSDKAVEAWASAPQTAVDGAKILNSPVHAGDD